MLDKSWGQRQKLCALPAKFFTQINRKCLDFRQLASEKFEGKLCANSNKKKGKSRLKLLFG